MNNQNLTLIPPRKAQVGGTDIYRLLPYAKKRMVGPFIFFDHFPHTHFAAGEGLDVRPHPHIGLSTLSYLLEGKVLHHDSLGNKQILVPGDVNWMTAGKGISHSERMPEEFKTHDFDIQLLQFWVALPVHEEDREPSFIHYNNSEIPAFMVEKSSVRLVAGSAFDKKSPVAIYSSLFFMDVKTPKNERFSFSCEGSEIALYVVSGELQIAGETYGQYSFVVLPLNSVLTAQATQDVRFMVLGGEAFTEERFIFWNFVSSSKEKIAKAADAWESGTFPQVPGEPDIVPLPKK